jgi:hypothetical protein
MAANCFENIIGIKGQCGPVVEPSSGLYVQDLPYIDLKVADSLIEQEDSGVQFMRDKLNYAVNQVKNEINTRLMPFYKAKSVLEANVLGFYNEYMDPIASAAQYRGIRVYIDQYPYIEFKVSKVAIYSSDFTGTKEIKVWDLRTGQEVDSFDITLTAGEITYVEVNRKYTSEKQRINLFFGYDASNVDSFDTTVNRGTRGCNTCNSFDTNITGRYFSYNGGQIGLATAKLESNVDFTGYTSGLSLQYTVECGTEAFLCSLKDRLAFGILHKFGVAMCDEVLFGSKRVNSVTTIDVKKATALRDIFENTYQDSMSSISFNLALPNDICFKCNQAVKSVTRIP